LLAVDRTALAPDVAITFVQVLARQVASLAAVEAEATVAAVSGHPLTQELYVLGDAASATTLDRPESRGRLVEGDGERLIRISDAAREEYASALRIGQQQAHTQIQAARLLVGPLARTLEALAAGDITARHSAVLAEAAARLPGADAITSVVITEAERADLATVMAQSCAVLQDRVLPTAGRATVAITRQHANRAVQSIDPDGYERRRRQARWTRDAWVAHEQDGHSLLMARMGTARALACLTAIDSAATDPRLAVDGRLACDATIGERRVEALERMILSGFELPGTPETTDRPSQVRVHVDVSISLDSLLGLSDGAAEMVAGCGRGPRIDVTADEVRDLLADPDVQATMRRLVTDPQTGHLLDVGRDRYRIPTRLRDFVTIRDRTCRFPGCQRRASGCEIDHAIAWDEGGLTSRANLGALCVRHHQLKTHSGWTITGSHLDGSCTWMSPQGREHQHQASPISRSAALREEADARWRAKWGLPPGPTPQALAGDDPPF
jgi:hypothetical protein